MSAEGITGPTDGEGAVADHVAVTDPHTQYARIYLDTAGTYAVAPNAEIYVGDTDPGAVANGSVWIPAS